jgi:hypothetical protein
MLGALPPLSLCDRLLWWALLDRSGRAVRVLDGYRCAAIAATATATATATAPACQFADDVDDIPNGA